MHLWLFIFWDKLCKMLDSRVILTFKIMALCKFWNRSFFFFFLTCLVCIHEHRLISCDLFYADTGVLKIFPENMFCIRKEKNVVIILEIMINHVGKQQLLWHNRFAKDREISNVMCDKQSHCNCNESLLPLSVYYLLTWWITQWN